MNNATTNQRTLPGGPVGTTVFTGARLIVGDGSTVVDDPMITVQDGIVMGVTQGRERGEGDSVQTVTSFSGKTIMPALVNPHGHIGYMRGVICEPRFYSRRNVLDHLRRLVYGGISTFQSLGTDWNGVEIAVREEQRAGTLDDPDLATLFTAGAGVVAAPTTRVASGAPFFAVDAVHQATDAADARAFVRHLAAQRVDVVKFWIDDRGGAAAKLSPEACRAIVEEAHEHGIKAAAHIYTTDDARIALAAGVDILAHMPRSPQPDPGLVKQLIDRDVAVFTSMSVQSPARSDWLDDPIVGETLPREAVEELRGRLDAVAPEPMFDTSQTYRNLQRTFLMLHEAGVRLVYSPDTGVFAQLPGMAEHRELEALVEAGLPPLNAIEFATRRSSQLLGLTDRGTVTAGRRADLLVLDGDPRDDIRHTRAIAAVVLGGRVVDRAELGKRLKEDASE